ncbi:MAG: riboflavin synthase [Pseudomonadota bacterium]
MFTGIIKDIGEIQTVDERDQGRRFRIKTEFDPATIDIGASIACNGVCLTVVTLPETESSERWFEVEAWAEALKLTNAANWSEGSRINLERSLKMGDELGGHMVSGHVDGTAEIVDVTPEGDAVRFLFELPEDLVPFVVPKGSVALDGTSLTVNGMEGPRFDVLIIDHTLKVTTWGRLKKGDIVNVEVDQFARYVVSLVDQHLERRSQSAR